MSHKVGFYYHMVKGRETAESYIELPVSGKRYEQLFKSLADTESEIYAEVKYALRNIAKLQGYRLTGFHPEFAIKVTEDAD